MTNLYFYIFINISIYGTSRYIFKDFLDLFFDGLVYLLKLFTYPKFVLFFLM